MNKTDSNENKNPAGLVSMASWIKAIGRSDTTGWRWARAGWISPFNIAGRPYLTAEDIAQFKRRAESGEFSKSPHGAAKKSNEARKSSMVAS